MATNGITCIPVFGTDRLRLRQCLLPSGGGIPRGVEAAEDTVDGPPKVHGGGSCTGDAFGDGIEFVGPDTPAGGNQLIDGHHDAVGTAGADGRCPPHGEATDGIDHVFDSPEFNDSDFGGQQRLVDDLYVVVDPDDGRGRVDVNGHLGVSGPPPGGPGHIGLLSDRSTPWVSMVSSRRWKSEAPSAQMASTVVKPVGWSRVPPVIVTMSALSAASQNRVAPQVEQKPYRTVSVRWYHRRESSDSK